MELIVAILGGGSAVGWATTYYQLRAARRERRDRTVLDAARSTQDRLTELRKAYRRRREGESTPPSDSDLAGLEDALDTAAS